MAAPATHGVMVWVQLVQMALQTAAMHAQHKAGPLAAVAWKCRTVPKRTCRNRTPGEPLHHDTPAIQKDVGTSPAGRPKYQKGHGNGCHGNAP